MYFSYSFPDLTKWDLSRCVDLNIFGSPDESFELSSNQSNNITSFNNIASQDLNLTSEDLSLLGRSDNNSNDNSRIESFSNNLENESEKEQFYNNFYN